MLLAAAPGGVTTNLFTYLAKSNVPLSIVLTVIAPILVMATMPLWVWITVRLFEDSTGDVGVITVSPGGAIGTVIKAKAPDVAARLEKIIAVIGVVVLVGVFTFLIIDLGDKLGPLLKVIAEGHRSGRPHLQRSGHDHRMDRRRTAEAARGGQDRPVRDRLHGDRRPGQTLQRHDVHLRSRPGHLASSGVIWRRRTLKNTTPPVTRDLDDPDDTAPAVARPEQASRSFSCGTSNPGLISFHA
jgi:hypothetical protein